MQAIARRWCWRLGVEARGVEEDAKLVSLYEKAMREGGQGPDAFFFTHRSGRNLDKAPSQLADLLSQYTPTDSCDEYWSDDKPQSMLIEEVEAIWAAIDETDDWNPLKTKITALRRMGKAHGPPPVASGHE